MNNRVENSVVIMWPRLGPYHVARATSAAATFARSGFQIVVIETAETEATYAWDVVSGAQVFRRELLFPHKDYCTLSRIKIWQRVSDKLSEIRPSVVVVCGYAIIDAWSAIYWARCHGKAVVVMSESNRHDASRVWWREWIKRKLVGLCDSALVGGSCAHVYMQDLGLSINRIFISCDIIDNAHFANIPIAMKSNSLLTTKSEIPSFLTVCRFVTKKNLPTLLRAYRIYQDRIGSAAWRLKIAGDGPDKIDLQRLVNLLGLNHSVEFLGFLQYDQLPILYADASAFILPSKVEQWGLVVNEAMAAGLPVIVSRNAGCAPDLVKDGCNGWCFDPGSELDLANRMTDLHSLSQEQRQAMGQASRQIIATWGLERFSDGLLCAVNAAIDNAERRHHGKE